MPVGGAADLRAVCAAIGRLDPTSSELLLLTNVTRLADAHRPTERLESAWRDRRCGVHDMDRRIKESEVRGQIGVSFNLDSLVAQAK